MEDYTINQRFTTDSVISFTKTDPKAFLSQVEQFLNSEIDSTDVAEFAIKFNAIKKCVEAFDYAKDIKAQVLDKVKSFIDKNGDGKKASYKGVTISVINKAMQDYTTCKHPIIDFLGENKKDGKGFFAKLIKLKEVYETVCKGIAEQKFEAENVIEVNPELKEVNTGTQDFLFSNYDVNSLRILAQEIGEFADKLAEDLIDGVVYTVKRPQTKNSEYFQITNK